MASRTYALRRADGAYELVTYRHSPAVATIEGMRFREHEFELRPGDSLFVYTDGVTEALDKHREMFREKRLKATLDSTPEGTDAAGLIGAVQTALESHTKGAEQSDDITMLALVYHGNG